MASALPPTFFSLLLLLFPISAIAQTSRNITVGSSLSATDDNSTWLSPSADFAFGFHRLNNSDFFLLSIWYDKIPDRTFVWYANGDRPAPRGSKVGLSSDRGLVLTSPQGEELWTSQNLTGVVASGVMNDTGNFVLRDSSFNKVWESFLYPADTILPTQKMERGGFLSSRQSETKFSKGRFQLRFVQDGNKQKIIEVGTLVLNTINLPTNEPNTPYYEKESTVEGNASNPGKQFVFDESGYMYILKENEERSILSPEILSSENSYFRATLNFDGIFILYSYPKINSVFQENEKEFNAEVNIIGKTHHKNLVRLLGFCDEERQRLLVYEFLSNGTLSGFLFGDSKPDWERRIKIAFGVVKGLLYLHEECSTQIIHCDIKPQNILLDEYFNARISDFGLAKLLMMNQSKTHTAIRGTKGYVAPEWFRNMPITAKVDVYSFGVMLLEIICCRKSVDMESEGEDRSILTYWAYDCFQEGTLDALVDYDMDDMVKLERFVKVAIWCIQEDPTLRPTIQKVSQMLEGVLDVPVPPCPFPYASSTIVTAN
ncbi:G-type lectin S-receptor-like serine/threonine-protein kinase RLK1 [Juglans regia]|uniref:G-type lectin S-receptor-like serine/threonine-protein kinase RLK1 n=1 Tax=Juglans regia TaxID=51240 RepID=A0A6P9DZI8_JUGRE|nr:G-type lectin S-receptor-like serine/threonine-protein kinase RLK1 [Juglans regia]